MLRFTGVCEVFQNHLEMFHHIFRQLLLRALSFVVLVHSIQDPGSRGRVHHRLFQQVIQLSDISQENVCSIR